MERDDLDRRLRELVLEFFQAKLALTPKSVEVRDEAGLLAIRVRHFSPPAVRRVVDHQNDSRDLEDYYLRMFDQLPPLLQAGIGKAGPLFKFQTLLDLKSDECVFMLTLVKGDGTTPVESS